MNAAMVRAVLAGTKTQTRRMLKPWDGPEPSNKPVPADLAYLPDFTCYRATCPYGQPGDRLWVREAWAVHPDYGGRHAIYRADRGVENDVDRWVPRIHMPRWASRINLEVSEVRVERLQDISEADCWAEGIEEVIGSFDDVAHADMAYRLGLCIDDAKPLFALLWESINGPGSWDANPWLWVVSFRRIQS